MADDFKLKNYQDDLDTNGDDQVTEEQTDNLANDAGVPEETLKKEFDDMERDDSPLGTADDVREEVEDEDQDSKELTHKPE